jgi:hypothetical protein
MQLAQAETLDSARGSWILRSVVHTSRDVQILGTGMDGKGGGKPAIYFSSVDQKVTRNSVKN